MGQLVSAIVPSKLRRAPPALTAELPLRVQLTSVTVVVVWKPLLSLYTAPPVMDVLSARVQLVSVVVAPTPLYRPPPWRPPALPWAIVRPDSAAEAPPPTANTRVA